MVPSHQNASSKNRLRTPQILDLRWRDTHTAQRVQDGLQVKARVIDCSCRFPSLSHAYGVYPEAEAHFRDRDRSAYRRDATVTA
jgi:hypothetical protein